MLGFNLDVFLTQSFCLTLIALESKDLTASCLIKPTVNVRFFKSILIDSFFAP